MKNIVAFYGSPRKNGETTRILDEMLKGSESKSANIIRYDLNNKDIRGCQGCNQCRTNEGCSVKNDYLSTMYEDIKNADAIVFGTPIYFYEITGQSKTWLDRMYPMISGHDFKARYPGKKIATIFVQGASDVKANEKIIENLNKYVSHFGWDVIQTIVCAGTEVTNYEMPQEILDKAFITGVALASE